MSYPELGPNYYGPAPDDWPESVAGPGRFPGYGPGPEDALAAGGRGTWDYDNPDYDDPPRPVCFDCRGTGANAEGPGPCPACAGWGS